MRMSVPLPLPYGCIFFKEEVVIKPACRWELLTWRAPWSEVGGNPWQVRQAIAIGPLKHAWPSSSALDVAC